MRVSNPTQGTRQMTRHTDRNLQLYARILRLLTSHETHCRNSEQYESLLDIERHVIAPDPSLVWC